MLPSLVDEDLLNPKFIPQEEEYFGEEEDNSDEDFSLRYF